MVAPSSAGKCPPRLDWFAAALILFTATFTASSASYYPNRLEDPKAVYVAGPGGTDDTASLQQAINRVHETTGLGIVLVAPGRYRISDTVYIWPGIRVIGYGESRPVIVLPARTPGFAEPAREKVMFFFGLAWSDHNNYLSEKMFLLISTCQ